MRDVEQELRYSDVNDDVVRSLVVTGRNYYIALGFAIFMTLACFFFPWFYQLYFGIGAAGNNQPAVWGHLSCQLHILDRPEPLRHFVVMRPAHYQQRVAQSHVS